MIRGVGDNVDQVKYIVYSLVNGQDVTTGIGAKSYTLKLTKTCFPHINVKEDEWCISTKIVIT